MGRIAVQDCMADPVLQQLQYSSNACESAPAARTTAVPRRSPYLDLCPRACSALRMLALFITVIPLHLRKPDIDPPYMYSARTALQLPHLSPRSQTSPPPPSPLSTRHLSHPATGPATTSIASPPVTLSPPVTFSPPPPPFPSLSSSLTPSPHLLQDNGCHEGDQTVAVDLPAT